MRLLQFALPCYTEEAERVESGMVYDSETNSLIFAGVTECPSSESLDLGNIKGGWKEKTNISFMARAI